MKAQCRTLLRSLLRETVSTRAGFRVTNLVHGCLPRSVRRRLFYLCADERWPVEGHWKVHFAGRRVVLPLSRDFPLAWPAALGFDGYDPEMHDLYAALVRGERPPRVFFDVGASYGLHSLRLLAHGIRVVSFEPNPRCHEFFTECCRANGLTPCIEPLAVGEFCGSVNFAAPVDSTWLGSTLPEVWESWRGGAIDRWSVPQVSLDTYVAEQGPVPDLIKIDVEGAEDAVLHGAIGLLTAIRPTVLFESWPAPAKRAELYALLESLDYDIATVAMGTQGAALTEPDFSTSVATNFLARPREAPRAERRRFPLRRAISYPVTVDVLQEVAELVELLVAR
jgi:FkbM family methyltransferase